MVARVSIEELSRQAVELTDQEVSDELIVAAATEGHVPMEDIEREVIQDWMSLLVAELELRGMA